MTTDCGGHMTTDCGGHMTTDCGGHMTTDCSVYRLTLLLMVVNLALRQCMQTEASLSGICQLSVCVCACECKVQG